MKESRNSKVGFLYSKLVYLFDVILTALAAIAAYDNRFIIEELENRATNVPVRK